MAIVQVVVSRDRGEVPAWRIEIHDDGWCRLYHRGAPLLRRASIDEVRERLEAAGVDIERDLVEG